MTMAQDTPLAREIGDYNELPVAASTKIYEGAMVGDSGGYARGLVAGDAFHGHAVQQADNSSGGAGDINVKLLSGTYRLEVTLSGVAITDVDRDVYASADDTLTLTQGSNTHVGKVVRYVGTNTCVVEFRSVGSNDIQNHQHTAATDGGPLTSPRVVTGINDANGNELLKVTATASAINEFTLANGAEGSGPSLAATGGDTNIDATFAAKGTGTLQLGQATGKVAIATAPTDFVGFYGATPVVQADHIADPSGEASGSSTDAEARAAINAILVVLENLGIIKTS